MEQKQTEQKNLVASLQKEQKTVQQLIAQQQKEERELNAKIEREIKAEITRAEAEARRKAAEEARRKAAEEAKKGGGSKKDNKGANKGKSEKPAATEHYELPAADRVLSGSFEKNKGRLPIPITGPYSIIRGVGTYDVKGSKGVMLESKGMYFKGQAGAQARCIFDGIVSAIVQQRSNDYLVIVRHGRYISVYCNLSSVSVSNQQKVKTNQILGNVADNHILQFQLRNWTDILNPRVWLSK